MPNFSEFTSQFLGEWRSNSRFRAGIYLLLGTLWLYGVLLLRDHAVAEHANWELVEQKNSRARATAAIADWPTRAQEMKTAVAELEALLWRDGSIGLSQAAFEERIIQSLTAMNIPIRGIRTTAMAESVSTPSQLALMQLRARVQIDFRASTVYPWLASIARSKAEKSPTIFVESLAIRTSNVGQAATAEVELVGFAVKTAVAREPTPTSPSFPDVSSLPNLPKPSAREPVPPVDRDMRPQQLRADPSAPQNLPRTQGSEAIPTEDLPRPRSRPSN